MNKSTIAKWVVPAALLGMTALPTLAQGYIMGHRHPGGVDARLGHQEQRIRQGERNGSLTPREASRLQHREYRLRRQDIRAHMSGGRLTPQERARLEREENRDSRAISRQRPDAQHRY